MNLIGYVNRFKDYSFFEKPFTDVDAALFAAVVYSLFEKIGPDYLHPNDVFYFHELTSEQIIDINESSVFKKQNTKVLNIMKDSIRYKDVGVTLIMSVIEQEVIEQFCAMTFILPKVGPVVVYRGTDTSIEGWRENLNLTIHPITASHLDSVDYLNIFSKAYSNIPFIVIGHSKGGNLAYYATLYAPYDVTCHITHSYSFDGTGFVDDSFTKRDTYHKLLPQMIQIVPRQSFVGELFENPPNKTFIKSKGISLLQHNLYYWKVKKEGYFNIVRKGSVSTNVHHQMIKDLLKTISVDDKKMLTDVVLDAFSENGVCYFINPIGKHPIRKLKRNLKANYTSEQILRFNQITHFSLAIYFHHFAFYLKEWLKKVFKRKKETKQ